MTDQEIEELAKKIKDKLKEESSFLKHPLTLLVVGFILTTVAGGFITTWLSEDSFKNQQKLIYQEKLVERKISYVEDFSTASSTFLQSTRLLTNTFWRNYIRDSTLAINGPTNIRDAIESYQEAEKKWRVEFEELLSEQSIYFKSNSINEEFKTFEKHYKSTHVKDSSIYLLGLTLIKFDTIDYSSFRHLNTAMSKSTSNFRDSYHRLRDLLINDIESRALYD